MRNAKKKVDGYENEKDTYRHTEILGSFWEFVCIFLLNFLTRKFNNVEGVYKNRCDSSIRIFGFLGNYSVSEHNFRQNIRRNSCKTESSQSRLTILIQRTIFILLQ